MLIKLVQGVSGPVHLAVRMDNGAKAGEKVTYPGGGTFIHAEDATFFKEFAGKAREDTRPGCWGLVCLASAVFHDESE